MDLLVRSSGQDGIFIDGWLVGGGDLLVGHGKGLLLGGVCEWHYGGLFVTYNGNRWVRVIIVAYIYCAIIAKIFMDN